jgi:hypothetical protein
MSAAANLTIYRSYLALPSFPKNKNIGVTDRASTPSPSVRKAVVKPITREGTQSCRTTCRRAYVHAHPQTKRKRFFSKIGILQSGTVLDYMRSDFVIVYGSGRNVDTKPLSRWGVARCMRIVRCSHTLYTTLLVNTASSIHNRRHRNWAVSTVLSKTRREKWRRHVLPEATYNPCSRSQWPRSLRHEMSSLALTLGSWFRIPLKTWCLCLFCRCV